MISLMSEFLFAGMWIVGCVVAIGFVMFFAYMAIDYIGEKIYGKPVLTEENRKRWWV